MWGGGIILPITKGKKNGWDRVNWPGEAVEINAFCFRNDSEKIKSAKDRGYITTPLVLHELGIAYLAKKTSVRH